MPAMTDSILVTHGLRVSDKECVRVEIAKVEDYLAAHNNCYERTQPTEMEPNRAHNRVYVDIDGYAPATQRRKSFERLCDGIVKALTASLGEEPHSLMSSSQWNPDGDNHKLSYRVTLTRRHGTKTAVKAHVMDELFPRLRDGLAGVCPVVMDTEDEGTTLPLLKIDTGVYNPRGRKMRMLWSSKPEQDRPNVLCSPDATCLDTLITYIPPDSVPLPDPTPVADNLQLALIPASDNASDGGASTASTGNPVPTDISGAPVDAILLQHVLGGLARWRADSYDTWLRVGFICRNEGLGVGVWDAWSKQSAKYKAGECARLWDKFHTGALTQSTLWYWLKSDNPALYTTLRPNRSDLWHVVTKSSTALVSKYFYNICPDAYVYNGQLGWYELLPSNRWKHSDKEPIGLYNSIYNKLAREANEAKLGLNPANEEDQERLKLLDKFIKTVGTASFASGTVTYLRDNYSNDELYAHMDENRDLFAFADKVFNTRTGEMRPIRPTDWISTNAGYNMPTASDPAKRAELEAILFALWEDKAMVAYFLKVVAMGLSGFRKDALFTILTGTGGNGKSVIIKLLKTVFGGYFLNVPSTLLTKRQGAAEAPHPAKAQMKGKRLIVAQEPEAEEKFQVAIIKEITGGDTISARKLYRDNMNFVVQGVLLCMCNDIPILSKPDGGIRRRTNPIPFPFKFVENPMDATHRKVDKELERRMETDTGLRDELALMLMEVFPTIGQTLEKPPMVKARYDEYMGANNPVLEWLTENYVWNLDPKDKRFRINASELRARFIAAAGSDRGPISKESFATAMGMCGVEQARYGKAVKGEMWDTLTQQWVEATHKAGTYWVGLRPKTEDEMMANDEEEDE